MNKEPSSQQKAVVSKEDFTSWQENAVTRNVLQELINRINTKVDMMASGGMLGPDCEARYANAVGYIAALTEVLEIEPSDAGVEYGY